MLWLPLPMVIAGVLVALLAKVMLVLPPPGILALTEAMFLVLELENKGERVSKLVVGAVGIVDVAVVVFKENHDFLVIVVSGGGSEVGIGGGCSATTEEYLDGLVGGVVLAGIDVDEQRAGLCSRGTKREESVEITKTTKRDLLPMCEF